jgi:hypothetical protein
MKSNLTIVTVVKDDFSGLLRTKQSLNLQENSIHWIIVTPNVPGLTFQLAQELLEKREIDRIIIDQGSGIYNAMNLALANIDDNQWVWFLNAGDEVAASSTIKSIQESLDTASADWIYGGFYVSDQRQKMMAYHPAPEIFTPKNQLFSKSFVSHQSVIMRSNLMKSLNGFSEQFKVAADWDLLVRASLISKPVRVNFAIAVFYLGGFSTANRPISNRELLILRTKYLPRSDLPFSYCWYFYRIFRNRLVIFLEGFDPKYLGLLRRVKLHFLRK